MFYYGIVEDRNDPLKIGRVRVRVHGLHTDNKSLIATPDLPWSQVIMPATTAGLGGFGTQHSIVEGTTVYGHFRDDDLQDFVVLGVGQGISQKGYKETVTDELLSRTVTPLRGFNDPRRTTQSDYEGTDDGLNPPSGPRPNALSLSLETSPQLPKEVQIEYTGAGSKITEFEESEKTLPYYPLVTDASDINVFSTGDAIYTGRDMSEVSDDLKEAKSNATPMYPFNKALYTESGHILELDDTRGNERISLEHRTGTFYEIDKDGNQIHRVVNDNYTVICKNNEVYIGGKVNIKVLGDAKIHANGKVDIKSYNDTKIDASGKIDLEAGDDINIKSAKTIKLSAQDLKLNS